MQNIPIKVCSTVPEDHSLRSKSIEQLIKVSRYGRKNSSGIDS